jgi:hypothetical protein
MSADKYYALAHAKEMLDAVIEDREKSLRRYDKMISHWGLLICEAEAVSAHDVYDAFRKERVRLPITQESKKALLEEPMKINKIKNIAFNWKKNRRVELPMLMVIEKLTEEFGPPVNGEWTTFIVFSSDESVELWDTNHS